MTIKDIRYYADAFMEMWAMAHQEFPIYEGGSSQGLWLYPLAQCRANLEMALALYQANRFKSHIGGAR